MSQTSVVCYKLNFPEMLPEKKETKNLSEYKSNYVLASSMRSPFFKVPFLPAGLSAKTCLIKMPALLCSWETLNMSTRPPNMEKKKSHQKRKKKRITVFYCVIKLYLPTLHKMSDSVSQYYYENFVLFLFFQPFSVLFSNFSFLHQLFNFFYTDSKCTKCYIIGTKLIENYCFSLKKIFFIHLSSIM